MGENGISRGTLMSDDELRILFDELRKDVATVRLDIALLSYDIAQIKQQLDKQTKVESQESMGIIPNTPPPNFLPPGKM